MSLRLLIRDHPARSLAMVTDTHALVFRHGNPSPGQDQAITHDIPKPASKCMVEFSDNVDLSDYRTLRASGIHGTLGLINIGPDVFLCVISSAVRVATVRPNETVQKILSVDFYCLNSADFDLEFHQDLDPYANSLSRPGASHYGGSTEEAITEHPCHELKRILSGGTFYYSVDFDLTNRLQDRLSEESAFDADSLETGYLWNQYMIDPLIRFRSRLGDHEKASLDSSRILTSAIRGFVLTINVSPSVYTAQSVKSNLPATLTLISRLSCRRAGTRFNSRGIDDDGNVANFVETETIFWHPSGFCFSYAQVRGSVPLFWEQATGLLPGQQKIQITRSAEATQPAFDKHFDALDVDYGTVNILNLLSESKPGEAELTARYKAHVDHSPLHSRAILGPTSASRLFEVQFDFHAETRGGGYEAASAIRKIVQDRVNDFGFFLCEDAPRRDKSSEANVGVVMQQEGVFRTNCLDCLDRTNLIQTILSQMTLELLSERRGERAMSDFWIRHSSVWADNGDALSKIYAGTGALKSSFTRHGKMSLAGAIADARKSATRLYVNNFVDKGRQNTIDMLLGRLVEQSPVHLYDPITDYVNSELKRRIHEYSAYDVIHIWAGTFNLNGKGAGVKQDLSPWLCPEKTLASQSPEIVAVGFQEIVELSPQQIMSTDPVRRQAWEDAVKRTLNDKSRTTESDEYVLLRSGQLVGAALMIFIKVSALPNVKNVEGSVKKTGMSGIAGNKGAVAIRMDYANTRLCFVTAHLAAGFANFEERNRDYRTISHGLRFQRNRSIEDHDTIIWAGDFNYRIGLGDDKVRRLTMAGDLDMLYGNDQLNLQMVAGRTFPFYSEARITFPPTYKFDNGTDNYDSSEKARIPAWCDRILRKGDNLKQLNYATAPLRFSDHRPVYANFQCTISVIDVSAKDKLSQEIYEQRRADIGDTTANAEGEDIDDEDLIGYDAIAPELPPASSDRRKWWLDNGRPVRSSVNAPGSTYALNQQRPNNPFTPTSEPDWVLRSRPVPPPPPSLKVQGAASLVNPNGRRASSLHQPSQSQATSPSPATTGPHSDHAKPLAPKSIPPVPRKPDQLMSNAGGRSSNESGRSTELRTGLSSPSVAAESRAVRMAQNEPPSLPTRDVRERSNDNSGLLDQDDGMATTIPPLQPSRRM